LRRGKEMRPKKINKPGWGERKKERNRTKSQRNKLKQWLEAGS